MNRALCKNSKGVGSSLAQAARVRGELAVLRLFVFAGQGWKTKVFTLWQYGMEGPGVIEY